MRCNECNKFASYGDLETECNGIKVTTLPSGDSPGAAQAEVVINLPCGECGGQLKTYDFETATELPKVAASHHGDGHTLSLADERMEDTQRRKGRKQFYGYKLTAKLHCSCHGLRDDSGNESVPVLFEDEVLASDMDECW